MLSGDVCGSELTVCICSQSEESSSSSVATGCVEGREGGVLTLTFGAVKGERESPLCCIVYISAYSGQKYSGSHE